MTTTTPTASFHLTSRGLARIMAHTGETADQVKAAAHADGWTTEDDDQ